jgi:hypothetical protein
MSTEVKRFSFCLDALSLSLSLSLAGSGSVSVYMFLCFFDNYCLF